MYRSKIGRTRLDATTNWAVVTTGLAMSIAFSASDATLLPIVLVSFLVSVFWVLEALALEGMAARCARVRGPDQLSPVARRCSAVEWPVGGPPQCSVVSRSISRRFCRSPGAARG
jgi:hypothetical protein